MPLYTVYQPSYFICRAEKWPLGNTGSNIKIMECHNLYIYVPVYNFIEEKKSYLLRFWKWIYLSSYCLCVNIFGLQWLLKLQEQNIKNYSAKHYSTVNFTYLCSNKPSLPAYKVFVSQLNRYARACSTYGQFLNRGKLLTNKLLQHHFVSSMVVTKTLSNADWRFS